MATFHGFKITSMRSWTAREGVGTSGNLHWNGRKLGEFVDYGDGGATVYRFPTRELEAAIAEQLPEVGTLDMLVAILADMTESEKWLRSKWRKAESSGRMLVSAQDGDGHLMCASYDKSVSKSVIEFSFRQDAHRKGFDSDTLKVVAWDKAPKLDEGARIASEDAEGAIADYRMRVRKHQAA